jgi:chromosome partitioning protein
MQKISLISQKGGSGKSTLAVHLAVEASMRGRKVLLVDLDPQGNAVQWGARRHEPLPDVSAESVAAIERVTKAAIAEGYDLMIFDTAPHADQNALAAARAAEVVLIPCRPSQFDLEAVRATLDLCVLAKRPSRVVLNAAPIRSRVVAEAQAAIATWKGVVLPAIVRERVAFRHCMPEGKSACEIEPGSPAAAEISALYADMTALLHANMTECV